jgi:hypothetical protein
MLRVTISTAIVLLVACGARPEAVQPVSATTDPAPEASLSVVAPHEPASVTDSCGPMGTRPTPSDPVAALDEARALRDAGHFVEAADLLEGIVRSDPHHEIALAAVELSLDALNRAGRGAHGLPTPCAVRIGALASDYRSLLGCAGPGAPAPACDHLERLRCDALRVEGESLAESGELARASLSYERVHRTGCTTFVDQALYNAALLARRAGDPSRADALLVELARVYPESPVLRVTP